MFPEQKQQQQQPESQIKQVSPFYEQMNPDQQNLNNVMMAQPLMPLDGNMIQNPYTVYQQQLFQLQGQDRLKNMNQAYLKPLKQDSYSDLSMCQPGTTKLGIKSDQYSAYSLFEIDFGQVKCFQTNLKGPFYAQRDQQQSEKDQLYEAEYNRKCFGCKCCFIFVHPIGMINWCICACLNPSTATLNKNGQILYQYQLISGGETVLIKDGQGNIKYQLKYISRCSANMPIRVLYDSTGQQEVPGFNMQTHFNGDQYLEEMQTVGVFIGFPPNMSEDDKAGIIFALMRMN